MLYDWAMACCWSVLIFVKVILLGRDSWDESCS